MKSIFDVIKGESTVSDDLRVSDPKLKIKLFENKND
jgi:hypothetical protein